MKVFLFPADSIFLSSLFYSSLFIFLFDIPVTPRCTRAHVAHGARSGGVWQGLLMGL